MALACSHCACTRAEGAAAHALLALLAEDDLDAALAHGLLAATACPCCGPDCHVRLSAARDARYGALAARDRHRARDARLARRKAARDAARATPASGASTTPGLPPAAADALARALAKARGRNAP